jgi:hypothetical protein
VIANAKPVIKVFAGHFMVGTVTNMRKTCGTQVVVDG